MEGNNILSLFVVAQNCKIELIFGFNYPVSKNGRPIMSKL